MKKATKIILIVVVSLILLLGLGVGVSYYYLKMPQISLQEEVYIYIFETDSTESVLQKIEEASHPRSMLGFRWLAAYNNFDEHKRTGKYALRDSDDMYSLYKRLIYGEQTPVKVVIPAVRTIDKLISAIDRQLMLDSVELADMLTNHAYLSRLGYSEATVPALFIPNTYEFYWNVSINDFMARILKENHRFWNEERKQKAEAIGLTPIEVATLASIVEEETNLNAEKPMVAGLYINRLKKGMLLQADPTVKFALQDFAKQRILLADLTIDSPYNTYKYKGLPPGPIRIPEISGLESVLNHAHHNYLYMCAKEDFSGGHNFATTLSQHNANARRYQQELNKRKIK